MFGLFRRAPTEDQLRVTQALAGYPPYVLPEWKPDPTLESMRAASFQYRDYFLENIPARLDALGAFLANFDVALGLDDAGLTAVSAWLPRYGDLLVNDLADEAVHDAYRTLEVPWTGSLIGLNPIFDLAIYYAECLWARRTKLKWQVGRGVNADGYLMAHHIIVGLPGGKPFDPFNFMYWECRNIRGAKLAKKRRLPHSSHPAFLKPDNFSRRVLGSAPPGRRGRKTAR